MLVERLKANLISVSQLCDDGLLVRFNEDECTVYNDQNVKIMNGIRSSDNCYLLTTDTRCFNATSEVADLRHQRLGHTSFRNIQKLISLDAVKGIPKIQIDSQRMCETCPLGKQTKVSHPKVVDININKVLDLLHMDLMGLIQTKSLRKKLYAFVCVDEYPRYTWVDFLRSKSKTFRICKKLILKLEREKSIKVSRIWSDHGTKFENTSFNMFSEEKGIFHEYSAPITPQQNRVVEGKNRILQELVRAIMKGRGISHCFWTEAMNLVKSFSPLGISLPLCN